MFTHLRSSSSNRLTADSSTRPKNTLPPYNTAVSLAFAAALMPSMYSATLHVLSETAKRLPKWTPTQVIDFGSGTSSVAWALAHVYVWKRNETLRYAGIDQAKPMQWLAADCLKHLPPHISTRLYLSDFLSTANPSPLDTITSSSSYDPSRSLAITAFTLSEITHPLKRQSAVEKMWQSGAEMIIIIDRGTPSGFNLVADARAQLLALSKKSTDQHGHVVAPCPHDKPCPLRFSQDFCHFSQRRKPSMIMHPKKALV